MAIPTDQPQSTHRCIQCHQPIARAAAIRVPAVSPERRSPYRYWVYYHPACLPSHYALCGADLTGAAQPAGPAAPVPNGDAQ